MKTERLLNAIGEINDELIAAAEIDEVSHRKKRHFKWSLLAACLALFLCTGISVHYIHNNTTVGAFTMDVNPSVEYTVAKNGTVKNVDYLNSDAKNALKDIQLNKQNIETALSRTITAYESYGYIDNGKNIILVSFDSRINGNLKLKTDLSAKIKKTLEQTNAVGTLVFHTESDNVKAEDIAKEYNVSHGKADWILAASNKTNMTTDEISRLTLDELLKLQENVEISPIHTMSMQKINQIAINDTVLEKKQEEMRKQEFISLDEAKKIALKDAGLDINEQKIVFTREELNRNQGKPCYILEFYTGKNQYFYKIDAKTGKIIFGQKYILLSEAKKIAIDDSGCKQKVKFTEETLVGGGIKTPYYRLIFSDGQTQWYYRIDAVLGIILEKQVKEIGIPKFISLQEAKNIALKDAGLDINKIKIVFTREELNRNQGKPCYLLEFYTGKYQYSYKIDAKTGEILEKNNELIEKENSESVSEPPKTSYIERPSDDKHTSDTERHSKAV